MENKTLILYLCGIHSLGFGVFHLLFWKLFGWKKELKTLSLVNRAIMQIANLRLVYLFVFVAFLCFWFPEELHQTELGRVFLIGMALFWAGRTIEQFIFLRLNHIAGHFLTFLFVAGSILFLLPVIL